MGENCQGNNTAEGKVGGNKTVGSKGGKLCLDQIKV